MLDPMTLDQMRVLAAVAETGSFSAAARRLGRVQSAISQSVHSLETALGIQLFERDGKLPKLNEAGRIILAEARRLLEGADSLKARAESIAHDVEPELTLAVEAIVPNEVLISSLKALSQTFPWLPVTLYTEGLGGAEQRLRDGLARLGLYIPFPALSPEHEAEFMFNVPTTPVVAASHRLASEPGPLTRGVLEREVQLVLTDRTQITAGISGSVISQRIWRFADLSTRLDFLLAGFGWCFMPTHLIREHVLSGRLKMLELEGITAPLFPVNIIYKRGRPPGRAGQWLIDDLRRRLPQCVGPMSLPADQPIPESFRTAMAAAEAAREPHVEAAE